MKIHIVQKGDTLWKIAKKYGVNFEELKKLNSQLSNPDMIMPGMKIKVPTSGGTVKKEGANPGIKKEVPLTDHPFAKEKPIPIKEMPIKEVPIKEVPIKEQPIVKEAPKAPYTPKMPLQVVPEIDINNYYMMNMQQMKVEQPQLPPKPANILPEVKEVPKKEIPIPMKENPIPMKENPIFAPPPKMEAPVEMPMQQPLQDYCVPVTPIMPGPGFCPPYGGFPIQPYMPYPTSPAMPMAPGMVGGAVAPMGGVPGPVGPMGGAPMMPYHFDESSSFMPHMPAVNPGAVMGAQMPGYQQPMQMDPAAFGQMPGYQQPMQMDPAAFGQMPGYQQPMQMDPAAFGQMPGYQQPMQMDPAAFGQMPGYQQPMQMDPAAFGQMPAGYGQPMNPYSQSPAGFAPVPEGYAPYSGYGQAPGMPPQGMAPMGMEAAPQGQMMPETAYGNPGAVNPYGVGGYGQPYGYPQMAGPMGMMGPMNMESPGMAMPGAMAPAQGLPMGTVAMNDCGCGASAAQAPVNFVPPTPPIYSAPYTGPANVAQPPFMNPYGMGPMGTTFGMPGYQDESS